MSQDPYSGSGATPDPQEPTPNPYDIPPPQNPYDIPPPQNTYDIPPPQPPYGYALQPQAPYGYAPPPGYGQAEPQSTPLPLSEAIRQLPQQYIKVLTKPSARTFAEEMGKASWDITWVQLLGVAVIQAIFSYLGVLIGSARFMMPGSPGASTLSPGVSQAITLGTSIGLIVFIPVGFFIHQGITYLIAKGFGGNGTFLRQSYTSTLIQTPLNIIAAIASLIPILGLLIALAASVYEIVLQVFSIMAVHRLTGGKATGVVLLPLLILFVVVCVIALIIGLLIAAAMPHTAP